jgi:hypothetical protein
VLPLDAGSYFTTSFYAFSSDMTEIQLSLDIYDVEDTLLETVSDIQLTKNTWNRHSITYLVNATSTASYAVFTVSGNVGTIYIDMVQAEDNYKSSDYFDGSMPVEYGALWLGTAHNSHTILYPSKLIKMPRLAYTMVDWLPLNTFWRISTPAGIEFTNLTV